MSTTTKMIILAVLATAFLILSIIYTYNQNVPLYAQGQISDTAAISYKQ